MARFAKALGKFPFMFRIPEREKEANGNGIRFGAADNRQQPIHFLVGQFLDDRAVPCESFVCTDTVRSCNQRLRLVDEEVVELRSSLTSDFENILKSRGGYQNHAAAASFEKGIGAHGRSANQIESALIAED